MIKFELADPKVDITDLKTIFKGVNKRYKFALLFVKVYEKQAQYKEIYDPVLGGMVNKYIGCKNIGYNCTNFYAHKELAENEMQMLMQVKGSLSRPYFYTNFQIVENTSV